MLGFGAERYLSGDAAFETIVEMQNAGIQAWYAVPLHFEQLYELLPTVQSITLTSEAVLILLKAEPVKARLVSRGAERERPHRTSTTGKKRDITYLV